MRIASFTHNGENHWGLINEQGAIAAYDYYHDYPTLMDFVQHNAPWQILSKLQDQTPTHAHFEFLKPLHHQEKIDGKIICVGVNFPDRNAEYKDGSDLPKHMSLFPRFASSFVAHQQPLIRPLENHTLDYEGEMVVIMGRGGRRISEQSADEYICALSICNEGTIRDWVRHAKFNVTQGKNWDNSGAIGPWLVPYTQREQIDNATITTRVNGEVRQQDNTKRMMFSIRQQIAYISTFTTLNAGDMIVTGTPTGAGARLDPPQYLTPGDVVEVTISGIGTLTNTIEDEVC